MSVEGRECCCGPESGNGQPTPTTTLPTLAIALAQLLELAAVLRLAGLLFDLLDKLLAEMTDEVAEMVLEDNRLQTLALSIAAFPEELPTDVIAIERASNRWSMA